MVLHQDRSHLQRRGGRDIATLEAPDFFEMLDVISIDLSIGRVTMAGTVAADLGPSADRAFVIDYCLRTVLVIAGCRESDG